MTGDTREFERGIGLGPRLCDSCGEWLPSRYMALDECFERVVAGTLAEQEFRLDETTMQRAGLVVRLRRPERQGIANPLLAPAGEWQQHSKNNGLGRERLSIFCGWAESVAVLVAVRVDLPS